MFTVALLVVGTRPQPRRPPPALKGVKVMSTRHEGEGDGEAGARTRARVWKGGAPHRQITGPHGGTPVRPPRARLTSTCFALKTMPCAPSPMRPRMQYCSIARPRPVPDAAA